MSTRQGKRFSIIIPSYNYGRFLPRAIESVLSQPGNEYQIIVVNDGSTDDTVEVVKAYQEKSACVTAVRQENRGLAASRNRGIQLSGGEYLLFLDADDELLPDSLSIFRSMISQKSDAVFVVAGLMKVSSAGSVKLNPARPLSERRMDNFLSLLRSMPVAIVNGNNVVHRRVFNRISFPETVRLWRIAFFYGQLLALFIGVYVSETVLKVYRHPDSLSHNVELIK